MTDHRRPAAWRRQRIQSLAALLARVIPASVAIMLVLVLPLEGQGRPLMVRGEQDLSFGVLLPGVPTVVLPFDAIRVGRIRVSGARNREVLVSFFSPGGLIGPGGASIPLSFGPGSAGYSADRDINSQTPFDPSVPTVLRLPGNGRGTIYLGGTASPAPSIPAGDYGGTISLTVAYFGN